MAKTNRANRATVLHAIATEMGVDPELVGVVAKGMPITKPEAIKDAVKAYLSAQEPKDETPKPKAAKKASLTLSQRRALLKLQDEAQTPATGFKALPYDYLLSVGLAQVEVVDDKGTYTLTEAGIKRASEINPLYKVWSAGESVAGDESRPVAGTARATAAEPKTTEVAAA